MNDIAPDAASFLADMPFLDDAPVERVSAESTPDFSAGTHATSPAPCGMPDEAAVAAIPDSTDFLMEGMADGIGELLRQHAPGMDEAVISDDPATHGAAPQIDADAPAEFPAETLIIDGGAADMPRAGHGQIALLPPSLALNPGVTAPRNVLLDIWGVGKNSTLSARLGFVVGDLRFVVPFDGASELSEMVAVFRLPNVPSWFRGLANLHGNLVPVFDVAAMVGAQIDAKKNRMLLVLGHGNMSAGILIDELPTRIRLESANVVEVPELPRVLQDCVPKAYLHEQGIWLELQYQKFLDVAAERLAS